MPLGEGMRDLWAQRYPRLEGEDYQADLKARNGGLLMSRKPDQLKIQNHVDNILSGAYTDEQVETLAYRNPGIRSTLLGALAKKKEAERIGGQYFDPGGEREAPFIDEQGEAFGIGTPEGLTDIKTFEKRNDPEGAMLEALRTGNFDMARKIQQLTGSGASEAKLSTTILGARASGIPVKGFMNISPEAAQQALDRVQSPLSYESLGPDAQKFRTIAPRSSLPSGGLQVPTTQSATEKIAEQQRGARAIMEQANSLVDRLWSSETMVGGLAQASELKLKELAGTNPDVSQYVSLRNGFMALLIRALGEKGTLAEGDVERAKSLWPSFRDSKAVAKAKIRQVNQILDGVMTGQSLTEAMSKKRTLEKSKTPSKSGWSIEKVE